MEGYKTVEFKEVTYVGCCNCRLILSPKYIIDGEEVSDTLFIYYGRIQSNYVSLTNLSKNAVLESRILYMRSNS